MALESFTTNPGSGGADFASDLVGSVHFPVSKISIAADGVGDGLIGPGNPMPVALAASQLVNTVPDNTAAGQPVRLIGEDITVARFAGVGSGVLSPQMSLIGTVGTGQAVSQAGGSLLVTTGTTANASTLIRSTQSWKGAWRMNAKITLSQRIANNNFAVVMGDLIAENAPVTINSATSITVALPGHTFDATNVGQGLFVGGTPLAGCPDGRYVIASVVAGVSINLTVAGWPASGSTTTTLFGRHHAKVLYNGTTATAAAWATQASGWANADTTLALNTSASPGHIVTVDQEGRRMYVSDVLSASSATPNHTNRGSSEENIPDDNVDMYLFLWIYNGTTAPASTTTFTVGFWSVEKYANLPVMIQGVAPQGQSAPLPIVHQGTQTVAAGLNAGTNTVGGVNLTPSAAAAQGVTEAQTAAATGTLVAKASAGNVYGVHYGAGAAAGWVMLFDSATVPADGAVTPKKAWPVAANGGLEVAYETPRRHGTGISVCFSSTGPYTKTLSANGHLSVAYA